ncbi:penicillin-binding transpeptidase domain-containing protein [Microbacterium oryzae]|uniref:penicillin-binding transpeptidase domain-containing protein n=1 Tax=Microbacterium oryzae TaxID=743009 RepID=UPI0025B01765|nr:penicillin-binding transpeptidase domain-containing protein [Microbacterium oryzae]MDN3309724.1 penicillin-binding transpeptidase domain-containing protein [Microbacterium oryzae]
MPLPLRRGASAAILALLLPLAACSQADDQAEAAADDLTAALSEHTLEGVALADPAAAAVFEEQVAPLADYDVEVMADEVEREGDEGTVALHWTWDVEGQEWAYDTTAALAEGEDEWVVQWDPSTLAPNLAPGERIEVSREFGERADILGAGDEPIVAERPVGRYGLDKTRISAEEVGESAERIASAVGIDPAAFRASAESAGPQAFVEAIVVREGEEDQYVAPDFMEIPGAIVVPDTLPLAPTRDFARELLGTVGDATAEVVDASDGAVRAGDVVGLSGLQQAFDAQLRGTPSIAIDAVGDGDERRTLAEFDGEDGRPLSLTLDPAIQSAAEEIIAGLGEDAPASAIVAIRPSTGEVLALANGTGGLDIASTGQYPPGSTFKLVTSLALIRAGASLDDVLSCPESLEVDGFTFSNYDDYPASALGDVTFRTAIANSCNTAVIGARDRIGDGELAAAAASLGLAADADLGYPASLGQVPEPEGETERAADLIGQGRILATPLGMATVAASIGAGRTVEPHLIADDEASASASPEAESAQPLTSDEASALQELMRAVVTEGSATFLSGILGEPVGAKTGTAEYGEPDGDGEYPKHSWMVGTHGDLAAAVFVEDGTSGAETAGPLLQALFERF